MPAWLKLRPGLAALVINRTWSISLHASMTSRGHWGQPNDIIRMGQLSAKLPAGACSYLAADSQGEVEQESALLQSSLAQRL